MKGYIVLESCEDYEQVLCLDNREITPLGGILSFPGEGFSRHIFKTRKKARDAINRTHFYMKAFGYSNMPEKQHCKIHQVEISE